MAFRSRPTTIAKPRAYRYYDFVMAGFVASLLAFVCGEFVNSYVLAKMKILTAGRWLWTRIIGSTIFGEAVDSLLYYPLAFYNSGIIPNEKLPVYDQGRRRGDVHAGDLQNCRLAEARRARGLLRPRHRFQSIHAEKLRRRAAKTKRAVRCRTARTPSSPPLNSLSHSASHGQIQRAYQGWRDYIDCL